MTEPIDATGAGFAASGLIDPLVKVVDELGYEDPTPIQAAAIPHLLEGRDVLGLAATGTGKTAAFTLPLLHRLAAMPERSAPRALVVVPTRELALQVARAVHTYGRPLGIRVLPVYGGASYSPQLKALSRGVDVVVATPGRALDRGSLNLESVRFLVLDEADEMLDMGFQEDIEKLLAATHPDRQTALFSATFPQRLQRVARAVLRDPVKVEVERTAMDGDQPAVQQVACIVRRQDKAEALIRVLDIEAPEAAIIFCRTRGDVDELADTLAARGYRVEALHGGFSQGQRERVLRRLRAGANDLLIATDVAARGLDVSHLTHVFNYDLPQSAEQYVHRIGRTGRAGRTGMAVSFVTRRERRLLFEIQDHTGVGVQIRPVPRVEDLRRRQLARVVKAAKSTLAEQELEPWNDAAAALLDGEEAPRVVAALLRMLHENEAPDLDDGGDDRDLDAAPQGNPERAAERRPPASNPQHQGGEWAPIWLSVGRNLGVRPGDLVGCITGEAGISGQDIGRIHIDMRYSVVEIRPEVALRVLDRLPGALVRGRPLHVRPYEQR
jgi:ATP-dependent RNA helicase DeaD